MSNNETPQTEVDSAETPSTRELADIVLDSFNGFALTGADIIAALEVAKQIVLMDCVADMLAATKAEEFVREILGPDAKMVN